MDARGVVKEVIRRVGLDAAVRAACTDTAGACTVDADGVDVTFAGGDRRRFELVIGADGLHSALRAMVFGPRQQFVHHLGLVLAFYSMPNEFGLDRWLIDYQDAGRSAGLRPTGDADRAIAMLSFLRRTSTSTTSTRSRRS